MARLLYYTIFLPFILLFSACGSSQNYVKTSYLPHESTVKVAENNQTNETLTTEKITDATPTNSVTENSGSVVETLGVTNIFQEVVEVAKEFLGTHYHTGGTSQAGVDCSGLVYSTFIKKNIDLPRTSHGMAAKGIVITKDQAQPGDLIFFKTRGRSQINHVGIITDINDGIKFIHASIHNGVIISSLDEEYYRKSFAQINRVIE